MAVIGEVAVNLVARTAALEKGLNTAGAKVAQFAQRFGRFALATGAAALSFEGIRRAVSFTVGEFAKADEAANKLRATLATIGPTASAQFNRIDAAAKNIQNVTPFGDEEVLLAITRFTQLTQITGKELDTIIPAAVGLSVVMDTDLKSAFEAMAKAVQGNFSAFGRYGIVLESTMSDQEKLNSIIAKGSAAFPIAIERVNTLGGAWERIKNKIGDKAEDIGKTLSMPAELVMQRFFAPSGKELNAAKSTPWHWRNMLERQNAIDPSMTPPGILEDLARPLVGVRPDPELLAENKKIVEDGLRTLGIEERITRKVANLRLESQVAQIKNNDKLAQQLEDEATKLELHHQIRMKLQEDMQKISDIATKMNATEDQRQRFIERETQKAEDFARQQSAIAERLGRPDAIDKRRGGSIDTIGFGGRSTLAIERAAFSSNATSTLGVQKDQLVALKKIEANTRKNRAVGLVLP